MDLFSLNLKTPPFLSISLGQESDRLALLLPHGFPYGKYLVAAQEWGLQVKPIRETQLPNVCNIWWHPTVIMGTQRVEVIRQYQCWAKRLLKLAERVQVNAR